MINLNIKTPAEINRDIAKRLVKIRKRHKLSQKALAVKSDISLGSLKRFEQSGDISLLSLTKLAMALDMEGELNELFDNVPFTSIEEVINEQG